MKRILLIVTVLMITLAASAFADTIELAWNAPTNNADGTLCVDLAGYNVYMRQEGGNYGAPIDTLLDSMTPSTITYIVNSPVLEGTVYFVITAVDTADNESASSAEVSAYINNVPPGNPTNVRIRIIR